MMRMKNKLSGLCPSNGAACSSANRNGVPPPHTSATNTGNGGADLEVRPCGMLVQKRSDSDHDSVTPLPIRVRVKYGSTYHELTINPQASFGELKKKLSELTGLHHEEQKIYFKKKEKDSKSYLDTSGVKDKSKLVLVEDEISQDRRSLELRKNAVIDKAVKSISQITLQVDDLAAQVSDLESVISKDGKVVEEKQVMDLIELLMNELVKLDGIVVGDGDVKLQRKILAKRIQKYVETLDMLKIKNSNNTKGSADQQQQSRSKVGGERPHPRSRRSVGNSSTTSAGVGAAGSGSTVVTTKWEMFDSMPPLISVDDEK